MRDGRQLWAALGAAVALGAGCGGGGGGSGGGGLPSLRDVTSAPAAIQTAARAVVRIRTAGFSGTGSFISPTGLLMTNNHVLGVSVCPTEGCWVQLTFLYQRGERVQDPVTVSRSRPRSTSASTSRSCRSTPRRTTRRRSTRRTSWPGATAIRRRSSART